MKYNAFTLTSSRYKPYVHSDMQHLSSVCCILLVTMSSVLLRSQSLLSSSRFINFDPSNPVEAAETQSVDVNYTIIILLGCIFTPFAVALKLHHILLACFVLLNKRFMQWKERGHLFIGAALSAADCNVNLQSKTPAISPSKDLSSVQSANAVTDAPSVRSRSASENIFTPRSPQSNSDGIVPERFGKIFTKSCQSQSDVSAREVVMRIASSDASFPEDLSSVQSATAVTDAPSVRSRSASENIFTPRSPQSNSDGIVPERFGMKFTPSQVSFEHPCDPVHIDLAKYDNGGDDASSIRSNFFRRHKTFQVHQNRDETFVVQIDNTTLTPPDASSSFSRPDLLRIDVLDALDDPSASLPVGNAVDAVE
jgi:hypothetical protein